MSMMRNFLSRLVLICVLLSMSVGCIGPMNATARVRTWNREIENRWMGELVYTLFRVPYGGYYTVLFLSDVIIWNSIEFWGGTNPIDPPDPERLEKIKELDARRHGSGVVEDEQPEETDEPQKPDEMESGG